MLILLSDRLRGRLAELVQEPGFLRVTRYLAMAHHDAKHVVSGATPTLTELIGLLPMDLRGPWREIRLDRPNLLALHEHVTHLCVVEPEREGDIRRETQGEQVRFHVPYGIFEDFGRLTEARLVAEDSDDAAIYEAATRGYVFFMADLRGLQVALHGYGGSGQNLADALRDHAGRGFTIAVADSDRKWPGSPEGQTLHALRKASESLTGTCVAAVIGLPCHEIENLLPPPLVLDSLHANEHDLRARCTEAQRLGLLGAAAPLFHLDLKRGLVRRDLLEASQDEKRRAFLRDVFEARCGRVSPPEGGFCNEPPDCKDRKTCRCVLFAGLDSKPAERVAARCRKGLLPDKSAAYFFAEHLPCAPVWQAICRQIFSFACAYARRRL